MGLADISAVKGNLSGKKFYEENGTFTVPFGVDTIWVTGCASGEDGSSTDPTYVAKAGEFIIKKPIRVKSLEQISIICGDGNTIVGDYLTLIKGVWEGEIENTTLGYKLGIHGKDFSGKGGYGGYFGVGGTGAGKGGDGGKPGSPAKWTASNIWLYSYKSDSKYVNECSLFAASGGCSGSNGQSVFYDINGVSITDRVSISPPTPHQIIPIGGYTSNPSANATTVSIGEWVTNECMGAQSPELSTVVISTTGGYDNIYSFSDRLYNLSGVGQPGMSAPAGTYEYGVGRYTTGWVYGKCYEDVRGNGGTGGNGADSLPPLGWGAGGGSCGLDGEGLDESPAEGIYGQQGKKGLGGKASKGGKGFVLIEW